MAATLAHIAPELRIEFPVMESTQLGVCIGMALRGDLPICIYPRWNFLLEATGMLVSHLDKIRTYSRGGYTPKVIIRTAVGSNKHLDPGAQHLGDFTEQIGYMLSTVRVLRIRTAAQVLDAYKAALDYAGSSILVELSELY
jgi:pyruvate/2-oxoglutarate/acetoin dehydrogenase E1 component